MAGEFLGQIKITFVDINKGAIDAFDKVFVGERYKNIRAELKDIKRCDPHSCIVSPANSFGQMDGGIDADLSQMLSKYHDRGYIGREVRKVIAEDYYGEQPVGTCILMETGNENYPYLAHAPTMRCPQPVPNTLNPYYAFRAVLQSIVNHNKTAPKAKKITSVLTTLFCTGCGHISYEVALLQMKKAYDVIYDGVGRDWGAAWQLCHVLEELEAKNS